MKRIKYIVALVAMVGIFSAQAAEVDSVNMVGFANVSLDAGLNIIGVPFVNVGDTSTTINDLLDVADLTAGSSGANSDVVTVWNGSGYDLYFLYAYAGPSYDQIAWVDTSFNEVDITVAPGEAVWLNKQSAGDVTYKGEVMSAASTDISLSTGLNMISYPYSIAGSLNDFDISNATAGSSGANSDVVTVWNGSGYDLYFLYAYAGPSYDQTAWVDTSFNEVDVDMPIGKGVWYNAQASTTGISADKPY